MSTSVVSIYNIALQSVGLSTTVAIEAEQSLEANLCRQWFELVRDQILRAAPWTCATGHRRLALISERSDTTAWVSTDPPPGWRYSYSQPVDMLRPRYLSTFGRFDIGVNASDARCLFTDEEDAILTYTKQQDRVDLWDPDLQMAVGFGLGAHLAMPLTGSVQKLQASLAMAIEKIQIAIGNAANETQAPVESAPSWMVARGAALSAPQVRYIYPYANFQVTGLSANVT